MNPLFISLYLDEDVDVLLADLLRARGFDVLTTQQAGQNSNKDLEQLAFAVAQRRTILTHNRVDFENIHIKMLEASSPHFGIIVASRHGPHRLCKRALVILNHITSEEMQNQILYI